MSDRTIPVNHLNLCKCERRHPVFSPLLRGISCDFFLTATNYWSCGKQHMWRGVNNRVCLICHSALLTLAFFWTKDTKALHVSPCPMVKVSSFNTFSNGFFLVYVFCELLTFRSCCNCQQPVGDRSLSTCSSDELVHESLSDVYATDHTMWNSLFVFLAINSSLSNCKRSCLITGWENWVSAVAFHLIYFVMNQLNVSMLTTAVYPTSCLCLSPSHVMASHFNWF